MFSANLAYSESHPQVRDRELAMVWGGEYSPRLRMRPPRCGRTGRYVLRYPQKSNKLAQKSALTFSNLTDQGFLVEIIMASTRDHP